MKEKFQILRMKRLIRIYLLLLFLISYSCGQKQLANNVTDSKKNTPINHDSLVTEIFHFGEQYFKVHTIEKLAALKGKPIDIQKKEWGFGQQTMLEIHYPLFIFNFLVNPDSSLDLESFYLLDRNIKLAGDIAIGKSTNNDIVQKLGEIKEENINKHKTSDTVNFYYNINIDEYAIGFITIKDTLRKINWVKNMN